MKHVWDKICNENQDTFYDPELFTKIVPFMS